MADHNTAQARRGILMDADRWIPPEPEKHSSADLADILKKADELSPFSSAKNMGLKGKGSAWAQTQTVLVRKLLSNIDSTLLCITFNNRVLLTNATKAGSLFLECSYLVMKSWS